MMNKHGLSILTLLVLAITLLIPISRAQFIDVSENLPEKTAIEYLREQGVLQGQGSSNRFDPNALLNRAEWAVLLNRYQKAEPTVENYGLCFSDVLLEWFAPAVCYAKQQGWVKGYQAGAEQGSYGPANPLQLAEILVTLARLFDWPVQEQDEWFLGAYQYAFDARIIEPGTPYDQFITRAQAAEILFRTVALQQYNVSQYDPLLADIMIQKEESSDGEEPVEKPVAVNLQAFPDQPAEATVAQGSLYVPVLRFLLEAEEPVTLDEIRVRRVSVGLTSDIAKARLMINGKTVQEGPFSGDHFAYWRNLNYQLNPGDVALAEMNIDFVEDAQPILFYQFRLDPENVLFQEAVKIQGESFQGPVIRTSSISADSISISNPPRAIKRPFTDSEGEIIGRFQIRAGDHDVLLKRIRLEDAGDLNSREFKNFRLTSGSQQIGFLEKLDRFSLDFQVDNYYLEAGRTRTFTIRADISGARTADTVRLYLEEAEHLYAHDFEYGFGVRVDNQFDREQAWCAGSESSECPAEGIRKRCSKEDIEIGVRDCEEEEEVSEQPLQCDDRLAPVCGEVNGIKETFTNRCRAEEAGAENVLVGPCP